MNGVRDRTTYRRKSHLRAKYGLEPHEYTAMVEEQRGLCLICETPQEKLVVDHDHQTGKVRGLLCNSCNAALGFLRDRPEVALAAARYLLDRS
ncbi:endonuclease VII domain-containing protein [Streptomyces sp. CB03911]|uniref:endonuclease VII domain-containing protein n=1 Tax=Streptomyces sp. CB03911 TaxID=1804758 RepID=UPI00093E7DB8